MKKAISILLLLLLCSAAHSQDKSLTYSGTEPKPEEIENYLDPDSYAIMTSVETTPISEPIKFALKTNLLYDIALMPSIEIEVPIGDSWSIAGEWMFPWWLWEQDQNCIQVLAGTLEARYWITHNKKYLDSGADYNPLSGWFVGLYGGGGLYDLELEEVGYQGEYYIATGVSLGYVHPFSKSLLMEFSLGVGYLKTDYRKYEAQYSDVDNKWHLIRQYNGSKTWIGPTKAKISLVWYPHFKKKGGER